MNSFPFITLLLLTLASSPFAPASPPATTPTHGYLRWDTQHRRVDADVQQWPLQTTLAHIAAATGWRVLVEPDLDLRVSARFDQRPEREALAALLSEIHFALLPSPEGHPTRLLVFRSSTSRATVPIAPAPTHSTPAANPKALSNEWIVRLKDGATLDIHALAARLGARVAGSLDHPKAHRLVFDSAEDAAAARDTLAAEKDIATLESNYALGTPAVWEPLPGFTLPNLRLQVRPWNDQSSVIVALIDTGLPTTGVQHPEFLLPTLSIAEATTTTGLSHGSAMFETVLQGLASSPSANTGQPVRVLPVDIYGGRAESSTFELAQGIAAALNHGADILNLSLSGPQPSPLVQDLLQQASQAGVLAFGASGNQPTTLPTFPAAYPEVIAVTASDRQGQVAAYANRGEFVQLIAPGTTLVPFAGDTWVVQGTSVATAYTSGLAASWLADQRATPSQILPQLQQQFGFQPQSQPQSQPSP